MKYADLENITRAGLEFSVTLHYDEGMGAPWREHDGHGPVREIRSNENTGRPDKRPGERVLSFDRGHGYAYDWQGAIELALRDKWGTDTDKLVARLGRAPTPREIAADAVERDFDYLRRWYADDWHWCGVVVTLQDADGNDIDSQKESLWGIESDAGKYLDEAASELADDIIATVGRRKTVTNGARSYRIRK